MRRLRRTLKRPWLPIALLVLFNLALGVTWFALTECPLGVFDLERGDEYARSVKSLLGGDRGFGLIQTIKQNNYFPPAYEMGLGLSRLLVGYGPQSALWFNLVLLIAGCWGLYRLGLRLGGRFEGFIAACTLFFIPSVAMGLRVASKEMALALWTPAFLAWVADSRGLSRRTPTLMAAAFFSLGMLFKWNFVIAALAPAVVLVLMDLRAEPKGGPEAGWRQRAVNLALGAVLAFVLTAPWYLGVMDWSEIRVHSTIDPTYLDTGSHWTYYLENLRTHHLLKAATIVGIVCVPLSLIRRPLGMLPAAAWMVIGYIVLSVLPHKESRYILPVLPALGLFAAKAIGIFPFKYLRYALATVLIAAGTFQVVWLSFFNPMLVTESAGLVPVEDLSCLATSKRAVDWLGRNTPVGDSAGDVIVLHPLTRDDVYLGHHALSYWLKLEDREGGNAFHLELWDFNRYEDFVTRFEELDLVLVPVQLTGLADWETEALYKDVVLAHPGLKEKLGPADPGMIDRIEAEMWPVAKLLVPCGMDNQPGGLILYVRRSRDFEADPGWSYSFSSPTSSLSVTP